MTTITKTAADMTAVENVAIETLVVGDEFRIFGQTKTVDRINVNPATGVRIWWDDEQSNLTVPVGTVVERVSA